MQRVKYRFLSTGFEINSLCLLDKLRVKRFSTFWRNYKFALLKKNSKFRETLIMSTGMASMEEVENAFLVLKGCGVPNENITILQCTSAYPTPIYDVNLRVLETLEKSLKLILVFQIIQLAFQFQ